MNAKVSESPYFETFPHGETFKSTFHSVKKLYATSIYKTPCCIYGIYSALVLVPFGLWNLTFTLIRNLFLALRIPQLWMQLWPTLSSSVTIVWIWGTNGQRQVKTKTNWIQKLMISYPNYHFHVSWGVWPKSGLPPHIGVQVAPCVQAKLMDAVLYLARCKHMQIPHGWEPWALKELVAGRHGNPYQQKFSFHVLHCYRTGSLRKV